MQSIKESSDWVDHRWQIRYQLQQLNLTITDAEGSLRSYYLTRNPIFLDAPNRLKQNTDAELSTLAGLLQNNAPQLKYLEQLRKLIDQKRQNLEQNTVWFENGGLEQLIQAIKNNDDMEVMDEIHLLDTIMEKEEVALLTARRDQMASQYQRGVWIGNVTSGIAILILLLFFRAIRKSAIKQSKTEHELVLAKDNLEATVLTRTEQLSALSRSLLRVSEQEKAKLARELHDEMGSNLTTASMTLSIVISKLKTIDRTLSDQLAAARQSLIDTVDLKRRIIEDLRPSMLDNLGLIAALKNHFERTTALVSLRYEADISGDFDHLDSQTSITVFRIAQEALNNTIKYAHADTVRLTLTRSETEIRLQILDDGVGIPADAMQKARTHGLLGMRERALLLGGRLRITNGPDQRGTLIEALLPIAAQTALPV
ncbi:MAG: CHASE3 domain-containing protein [Burkholderiaceae bacterium]